MDNPYHSLAVNFANCRALLFGFDFLDPKIAAMAAKSHGRHLYPLLLDCPEIKNVKKHRMKWVWWWCEHPRQLINHIQLLTMAQCGIPCGDLNVPLVCMSLLWNLTANSNTWGWIIPILVGHRLTSNVQGSPGYQGLDPYPFCWNLNQSPEPGSCQTQSR